MIFVIRENIYPQISDDDLAFGVPEEKPTKRMRNLLSRGLDEITFISGRRFPSQKSTVQACVHSLVRPYSDTVGENLSF
jgi:hypothetical protein